MRKIKTALLGSTLAVALSAPAMAADFHALAGLQGATPAPLQDGVLAATEGGAACVAGTGAAAGGLVDNIGVALCAALPSLSGTFANFAVFNQAPVTAAQFLQVVGF
ncbi:MAG: hypothetical protein ACREV4_11260 [Gammaproteobacteria bacterium]